VENGKNWGLENSNLVIGEEDMKRTSKSLTGDNTYLKNIGMFGVVKKWRCLRRMQDQARYDRCNCKFKFSDNEQDFG
jgi:hypothetical protein